MAGREVEAQKYRMSGDLERELWYDDAGNWLQIAPRAQRRQDHAHPAAVPIRAGL